MQRDLNNQKERRVVLASASPRRKELLARLDLDFEIIPAVGEEKSDSQNPRRFVSELSYQKAEEIAEQVSNEYVKDPSIPSDWLVIGADTIVTLDGDKLGKPKNRQDACDMIRKIQGRSHEVMTGVTVFWNDEQTNQIRSDSLCEVTEVYVVPMNEQEITEYVAQGESDDKAGAYGIQGKFSVYIEKIEGDYNNVVGLPICALHRILKRNHLI